MMLTRRACVKVTANASKDNISSAKVYRKQLETKRGAQVKDTLNKLAVIASADAKFVSETLKELDVMHKSYFDSVMKKRDESASTSAAEESDAEENIFLEKKQ